MCTVTFIPLKNGFVLTSSRDEQNFRPTQKPQIYTYKECPILYPKDEIANGTWIAVSEKKKIACLLNGGIMPHVRKDSYAKSRGIILLDSFVAKSHSDFMENVNLENIEPFTLLLIDYEADLNFLQLIWDGTNKHIEKIENSKNRIWSSVTLYSETDRTIRISWFDQWIDEHKTIEGKNILNFHSEKHTEDAVNNILMNRENFLQTVSITQIKVKENTETFDYYDLMDESITKLNLQDQFTLK